MPGIDWIPGVSQVKSLVQAATGDTEGAKRTAENFARECPVVSQVTSVVQLVSGDPDGALETLKICGGTVSNVANGIPVIGHAKGLIHHAAGDHEGGNKALNAATRSTVVVASGAAAGIATGGIGAIPAGIAAGVGYDASATALTGEDQGYIAAMKNVADNPSAGSIIDALAIPVGDGLAGYSGNQMATKIQLHRLEAAEIAKLDQMDAASTSGEALKYGAEAKAIHAEINTIKHGTPYVFEDPKTGTVVAEASTPKTVIPVPGYVDENDQDHGAGGSVSAACAFAVAVIVEQEDALNYDSYVEVNRTEGNRRKEAQKNLRKRDKQEPQGNLLQKFRNSQYTTSQTLTDLINTIGEGREPNENLRNCLSQLLRWSWLLLIMPEEFSYTVVAQVNSHFGGLYHSFIRHMDDWAQVIPTELSQVIERLSPLLSEINSLVSATNRDDAETARNRFLEARRQLSPDDLNDLQTAMVEIQISMHRFIQDNITFDRYLGRNLNTNGQERLYFRVETEAGTKAMVLCLSDLLYESGIGDSRPIRTLITVFFESWAVFESHGLLETKREMEEDGEAN